MAYAAVWYVLPYDTLSDAVVEHEYLSTYVCAGSRHNPLCSLFGTDSLFPPSLFGDCPYRYPLRASREARLIAESQFTPAPGLRRLAGAGFLDGQSMSSGAIEHGMFVCPHSTVLGGGCILQGSATFFLLPLPPHDTTCTFVRPIARPAATYGCSWVVR